MCSGNGLAVSDGELVMVVSDYELRGVGRGASDAELAAAARRDPSSFLELYERYFPRVQRYVRIRIADRAVCEDITSQVFVAALAGLGGFRGSGSFAAWLFGSPRTRSEVIIGRSGRPNSMRRS